jgi:hypothetical protein
MGFGVDMKINCTHPGERPVYAVESLDQAEAIEFCSWILHVEASEFSLRIGETILSFYSNYERRTWVSGYMAAIGVCDPEEC